MSIFYKSQRVGKNGKIFTLYKFRTMKEGVKGSLSTSADNHRLTKWGRWLRKYQLDELPQIWNILKGDMVLVGPRPELPSEFYSLGIHTSEIISSVKPGLTSPASLWDWHEEEMLKGSKDPHKTYCEKIKPIKMKLNVEYVKNKSFLGDIKIIIKTILKIFRG